MWNRVAEKTTSRRDKKVLYLAGPDAYDVGQACLRGFDKRNMIAIERDPNVLLKLRGAGHLAIDGEICDVLEAWPQERPVGVVIADFCCGMNAYIVNRIARRAAHHWPFIDTTFSFNFLRGREKSSRRDIAMCRESERLDYHKHRGEIFFQMYVASVVANSFMASNLGPVDWHNPAHRLDVAFDVVTNWAKPQFYSYRSDAGSQYFDSVVFKSVMGHALRLAPGDARAPAKQVVPAKLMPQRRRISAVLAHHTRRMA